MALKIEPYFNGKKSSINGRPKITTNKSVEINVYENDEDWSAIIKDANLIKRSNIESIKNALNHLNDLFKDNELKNSINSIIQYYLTTGILENSTTQIGSNVCYFNVNDKTCASLVGEVSKEISYGKKVTFVINSIKESTNVLQLLIKLTQSFEEGLFNLIIKDGLKLAPQVFRLDDNVEPKNQIPVFVVFRESDYVSAIESLPSVLNAKTYKNCLFLVQESQIKIVKELFDQLWPKLLGENKTQLAQNYKYELVNYDLNTILDNNEDENVDKNMINLLAFRDKFEAVKLLNHCQKIPFVSIWNRNLSICSFLAQNLNSTNLFWFNSVLKYYPGIPRIDFVHTRLLNKEFYFDNSLNSKSEDLKIREVVDSFLAKKTTKLEPFEIIDLVVSVLSKKQFTDQFTVFKYMKNFYHKLVNSKETKDGTFITKYQPIGFILLWIDDDQNLSELFNLIVSCVLSNNLVYLSIKSDLKNINLIKNFIEMFSNNDAYFKNMLGVDLDGDLLEPKLKSMIKHSNQHIGTCIKYSEQKNNVNFNCLENKLFCTKTIFKPKEVHDNSI